MILFLEFYFFTYELAFDFVTIENEHLRLHIYVDYG